MLFRNKMPKSCAYCVHGAKLDGEQILCAKRGFVQADSQCIWFQYDPCKRIPVKAKPIDFQKYENEDYTL